MANSPKKIDALAAISAGVSYVGGSAPVLLEPNAVVAANGNFAGETLTISGLLPNDHIGFSGLTVWGNTIQVANNKFATFSGGTMLELSGPLENTTITFRPWYWAASFTVSSSELYSAASSPATVDRTLCRTCERSFVSVEERDKSRL